MKAIKNFSFEHILNYVEITDWGKKLKPFSKHFKDFTILKRHTDDRPIQECWNKFLFPRGVHYIDPVYLLPTESLPFSIFTKQSTYSCMIFDTERYSKRINKSKPLRGLLWLNKHFPLPDENIHPERIFIIHQYIRGLKLYTRLNKGSFIDVAVLSRISVAFKKD